MSLAGFDRTIESDILEDIRVNKPEITRSFQRALTRIQDSGYRASSVAFGLWLLSDLLDGTTREPILWVSRAVEKFDLEEVQCAGALEQAKLCAESSFDTMHMVHNPVHLRATSSKPEEARGGAIIRPIGRVWFVMVVVGRENGELEHQLADDAWKRIETYSSKPRSVSRTFVVNGHGGGSSGGDTG